ncbi:MAG TPA: sigma-70 family RNA polymerase sigma factor [Polyangiaceae bacterium]
MIPRELALAREKFLGLVGELRPELHRYCSRLTGSVIDGEDVVQETLAKAFYALSMANDPPPLRPFLFRIAHNTALDLLRRYERKHLESTSDLNEVAFDEGPEPEVVRAALGTFLELPVAQRSAVILKDVLGCTLEEIVEATGSTLPAVKSALVRGRAGIRALATSSPKTGEKAMDPEERKRLHHYASLFNARDWDALRALIAEDARLDLVSRTERRGAGVGEYFTRYSALPDMRVVPGALDGRPALALYKPRDAPHPNHFVLLEWRGPALTLIRDFFYVPYIAEEVAQGRAAFVPDEGEAA